MRLTQFLCFEIGRECNLGHVHPLCPNEHLERYSHVDTSREMGDAAIIGIARAAYQDHGFRGLIGFHYYNEPLLQLGRMLELIDAIRVDVPESRFVLWTNGFAVPESTEWAELFAQIYITAHDPGVAAAFVRRIPQATIVGGAHDGRLFPSTEGESFTRCLRPFTELVFDFYGNAHICCFDWRGLASPGNVMRDGLQVVLDRWRAMREAIVNTPMSPSAPLACRRCTIRTASMSRFVPAVTDAAREWVARDCGTNRKVGVTFVSYRIPRQRCLDHLKWNAAMYEHPNVAIAFVVDDKEFPHLEQYGAIRYPKPLPIFSIAAAKNHGIHHLLKEGCEVIIATDVDVAFPAETWEELVRVGPKQALFPHYRMAHGSNEDREYKWHYDTGCVGTVAMQADSWRQVMYDERLVGYGGEDGKLVRDCATAGISAQRVRDVWHIAHDPTADQYNVPGHGRPDCWNRETGFNPDRFAENKGLMKRTGEHG